MISAKIIADSIFEGNRLTTFQCKLPKWMLAELNTHRSLCLDGDTDIYFDMPSGKGKTGGKINKFKLKDLYHKWTVGVLAPRHRMQVQCDTSLIDPEKEYEIFELERILGFKKAKLNQQCNKSILPYYTKIGQNYRNNNKPKKFILGKTFIDWNNEIIYRNYDFKNVLKKMHLRCANEDTQELTYTHIRDVMFSGIKPVFKLKLKNGYEIVSTKEHRFLTDSGWMTLEEASGLGIGKTGKVFWNKNSAKFAVNGVDCFKNKAWLEEKRKKNWTAQEMADYCGVSIYKIKRQLKKFKVKVHDLSALLKKSKSVPWNKGKTYKNPLAKSGNRKVLRGPESPRWKGGFSLNRKRVLNKLAKDTHKRFNYKCFLCDSGLKLHAHHLDPVWHNPEKELDTNNLFSVCSDCHKQIHSNNLELDLLSWVHNDFPAKEFWQEYRNFYRKPTVQRDQKRGRGNPSLYLRFVEIESIEYAGEKETYDLEVEGPYRNFVANGIIVHNSRNSSSARAIPLSKQIQKVQEDPFIPIFWGKNKPGMSATEEIDDPDTAIAIWKSARDWAVHWAQALEKRQVHKQTAARLLEPFSWADTIISGTEWENFFNLRTSPKSQPEMQELANIMQWLYYENTPVEKSAGEWHIPFDGDGDLETRLKRATARCARVSYKNHEGQMDIESDLRLHDQLLNDGHLSPFEHCAVALPGRHANFIGWKQYRKIVSPD